MINPGPFSEAEVLAILHYAPMLHDQARHEVDQRGLETPLFGPATHQKTSRLLVKFGWNAFGCEWPPDRANTDPKRSKLVHD